MKKIDMISSILRLLGTNDYITSPPDIDRVSIGGQLSFAGKGSPDRYDGEWAVLKRVASDDWRLVRCSEFTKKRYIPKDSVIGERYEIVAVGEGGESAYTLAEIFGLTVMRTIVTVITDRGLTESQEDASMYLVLKEKSDV